MVIYGSKDPGWIRIEESLERAADSGVNMNQQSNVARLWLRGEATWEDLSNMGYGIGEDRALNCSKVKLVQGSRIGWRFTLG